MTDDPGANDGLVLAEVRAMRAEVAGYRAETQAQRAEGQAIIDRLARAIDALEADMSAVIRRLFGEDGPPA